MHNITVGVVQTAIVISMFSIAGALIYASAVIIYKVYALFRKGE